MNILDKIVEHKKVEVAERKKGASIKSLEQSEFFSRKTISIKEWILRKDKSGIITEFKRKSPSKGIINDRVAVEQVTKGYVSAGASALSILTDNNFFGGSDADLITARKVNECPILRKDFTIDEYQIVEAKSIGADVILLIAAILSPQQAKSFSALAQSLGLEVLLEAHNETELKNHLETGADLIGVNNRDLKSFNVSIDVSKTLSEFIPKEFVKVSESGISDPKTIVELRQFGYEGFLMGENFMKNPQPEIAAKEFISQLKR